jgi:putative transposase
MLRRSRRLSASKTYHVMIRGNERKAIFLDDDDRAYFVSTLAMKNLERQFTVYAYCLMDNHVHLIINEGEERVSRIMKRLQVSYVLQVAPFFFQLFFQAGSALLIGKC